MTDGNITETGSLKGAKGDTGTTSSATGLTFTETTEPTTPSTNDLILYVDSVDGILKQKTEAGVVTKVGSPIVSDSEFRIQDNTDPTKEIAFEASGITTDTTRTLTVPDNSGTIALAETLTDKALYYWDATTKLFKPIGIGTTDQALIAKPSLDPPYQWGTVASSGGGREVLTANRTYYVRTDGSDSNNGLTDASGGAFLTWQKAINVAFGLDWSIYDVTIRAGGSGARSWTLTSSNKLKIPNANVGSGTLYIIGDETTPTNCVLTASTAIMGYIENNCKTCNVHLSGFAFRQTANVTANQFVVNKANATLKYKLCDFGALTTGTNTSGNYHLVDYGGRLLINGSYTISGGVGYAHAFINTGGLWGVTEEYTYGTQVTTITGTLLFDCFTYVLMGEVQWYFGWVSFSGSVIYQKYIVHAGRIYIQGGTTSYFPGQTSGSVSANGYYAN